jgi:hypothetical protein
MAGYALVNLKEVEDQAPKFGYSPNLEARFARAALELKTWDTVRVSPETVRGFEAGPEGAEYIAFGAPNTENRDAKPVPNWWTD